jgi:hypothetical protein
MPRVMQVPLDEWLSALSPAERRVHLALARDLSDVSPALSGLLRAVAAEIRADQWREEIVLRRLEDERRAEIEALSERAVWPKGTPSWAEVSGPEVPRGD